MNYICVARYTGTSLLDSPVLALREVLSPVYNPFVYSNCVTSLCVKYFCVFTPSVVIKVFLTFTLQPSSQISHQKGCHHIRPQLQSKMPPGLNQVHDLQVSDLLELVSCSSHNTANNWAWISHPYLPGFRERKNIISSWRQFILFQVMLAEFQSLVQHPT